MFIKNKVDDSVIFVSDKLDYKDFVLCMDAVNFKDLKDKIRWAAGIVNRGKIQTEVLTYRGLKKVIALLDQVRTYYVLYLL